MTKIACLGPEYTNTWLVAERFRRLLPNSVNASIVCHDTVGDVCKSLGSHNVDLAVLAIESRHEGPVLEALREIVKHHFQVFAELEMPIEHWLLGIAGATLTNLEEVRSHPQAFTQCAKWLAGKELKRKPTFSTALAAAEVAKMSKTSVAAIASAEAGRHYGLHKLTKKPLSEGDAATRFWVVYLRKPDFDPPRPTIDDKTRFYRTAFYLQVDNAKGSLRTVMGRLSRYNLLWLQSFYHRAPENDSPNWEYHFVLVYQGGANRQGQIAPRLETLASQINSSHGVVRVMLPFGTFPVLTRELMQVDLSEEAVNQALA